MKPDQTKEKYVAFLRGINVGGHRKVPMATLRNELTQMGFENVISILNSGNVIFDAKTDDLDQLEQRIMTHLENYFGFPIPTIVRKAATIQQLFQENPFKDIDLTKDIRLYISFLKTESNVDLKLPWTSADKSYTILQKKGKNILSVLDLSIAGTPKAMEALEKNFGKGITTRNWKTILRIEGKITTK